MRAFLEKVNPLNVLLHIMSWTTWKVYIGCTRGCAHCLKAWIVVSLIIWTASGHKHTSSVGKSTHLNRGRACSFPLHSKKGSCEMKVRWNMFSSWHGTKACTAPKIFLLLIMHVSVVRVYQCPGKSHYQCSQMENVLNTFRNNILSYFKVRI